MAGINEVIMRLLADARQYKAELDSAILKNEEFSKSTVPMGQRFSKFASTATTAVAGVGLALGAYGVDQAIKFTESLEKIANQSGASAAEVDYLKSKILDVSSATGISSSEIANAFLSAEKAGIRQAKAVDLVTAASKAAVVTGGDVTTVTNAIISAQTLQVAKGMSVAAVADLMVKANKLHIGSLDTLVGILQGRVGGALAAYGVKLAQAAAIADVASKAGYTNTRSMMTLATSLAKIENPTKSSTKALASFGVSASKLASDARTPGGIITVLKDLEAQSKRTGVPIQNLITAVFGASGSGLVSVLQKNLPTLEKYTTTLQSASGQNLNTVFGMTQGQLNQQLKVLKTNFQNAMTGLGLLLLPTVKDLANWATDAVKYFKDHPLVAKIASDATIAVFALAIGAKVLKVLSPIFKMLNIGAKSAQVIATDANTIALQENTIALGGKTGSGVLPTIEKYGKFAPLLEVAALLGAGYLIKKTILDKQAGALTTANNPLAYMVAPPTPSIPAKDETSMFKFGNVQSSTGMQDFAFITQAQQASLLQWASANKISEFSKTFEKAAYNFANQDAKGNYSVKVTVK